MKWLKTILIASLILSPSFALAQSSSLWKFTSSLLQPVVSTWNVYAPADFRFDGDLLPDGVDCAVGEILKKVGADNWDCAPDAGGSDPFTHPATGESATTSTLRFPYATTTYISATTSSTTNSRVSSSATFEYLGTGLAKITSGVLGLATAGVDYLASYDAWTHPYSGASATTSDIIITGKVGVATSTPLRDLDVLGTFSFGLQDSPLKKAEWTNLRYGESKLISGGDISFSGAADNWSVGSTTAEVNGRFWSSDSINGTVATSTFMIANKSIKDPFIYKEGSTYYAFYTVVSNSLAITDADIGYATSQDLKNWTDQGVLINHTSWWGGSTLPVWAPSVIKVGSTYYMFVTTLDGGSFKMGYATASSLTGTYTFVDYVKDAGGSVINYLDPHVVYYNGLYYMVAGNGNIKLWTATSLSANSWTLKSTLATITRNWENTDGVFEAPFLVPGTPNLLFYGASGSHDDQRIGLAVSNHIDGPYTKVGVDGQVFLDSPSEAVGPIDHPAVYYDKESSRWYLFASHGTTAGGHLFQRLAGYSSSDLSSWQSIATSSQLKPNVTNYVYVNPSGQLMAAADLPYDSGRDGTFPERQGYLRLGSLTVNSSRQVTASSAYQGKKTMLDWLGIGTSTPYASLAITNTGTNPSFVVEDSTSPDTSPFIIDASGQTSIGTTTANARLTVAGGGTSGFEFLGSFANSYNNHLAIGYDYDNNVFRFRTSGAARDIGFSQIGTEVMRLTTGGKVGIGTTTPGEKLAVDGNGLFNGKITGQYFIATSTNTASTFPYASTTALTVDGRAYIENGTQVSTAPSSVADLIINDSSNASLQFIGSATGDQYILFGDTDNDVGAINYNHTSNFLALTVNIAERLRIDSSGNIGIGTSTPQWLLNPFSATAPQLSLSAGAGIAQWTMRNAGGNLYFATTTVAGTATTSTSALTLNGSGVPSLLIGTTTCSRTITQGTICVDSGVGATASTTWVVMGKKQEQYYNSDGQLVCEFTKGTTKVIQLGACN